MNRRDFIKTTVAGGAALWLPGHSLAFNPAFFATAGLQAETKAYRDLKISEGAPLTPAEITALDAEIVDIKTSDGIALASLTCKLSLVNGTAFITTSSVDLRRYVQAPSVGWKFVFSAGANSATIYAKSAGTAETLGDELITNWVNSATYPFETYTEGAGTDIDSAINTVGDYGITAQAAALTAGKLFKYSTIVVLTSGLGRLYFGAGADAATQIIIQLSSATLAGYVTSTGANTHVSLQSQGTAAVNFSAKSNTLKQVTAPDATGVRGTATANGTDYNWAAISGINGGEASYTLTITRS